MSLANPRPASTHRAPARILVVEDDRLVLAGIATGLKESGYMVVTASSGEDALAQAQATQPDLVLMDVCLPGISGVEAAQRIREAREVPVIFISALDTTDVVRQAVSLGTLTYLVKPVTLKQLVPAIEAALARGQDLLDLKSRGEHLASALRQGREISVAIGILMERHNTSAEDAFRALRERARNTRTGASDVAAEVISGGLDVPCGAGRRNR